MHSHKLHYLSIAVIILGFIFIGIFSYMSFYPMKVWEVQTNENGKIDIIGDTFKAGDTIAYILNYCKYKQISGSASFQFVDGIIFSTPPVYGNAPVGCRQVESHTLVVPMTLPAGYYHLQITYTHKVNVFRTISVTYETEHFTIVK